MRRLQPPLLPDADEAREWAERELSKAVYHDDGRSWLEVALEAISGWIQSLADAAGGLGIAFVPILLLVVIAAITLGAFVLGRPGGHRRRPGDAAAAVLEHDDERTAAQLRAAARAAGDRGDSALAVVEMFRALVRGLDERAIGSDGPGRTAREAAAGAAVQLPGHAEELDRAARFFDAVRYGDEAAAPADLTRLVDLDDRIRRTRPAPAAPTEQTEQTERTGVLR
ncbi:DUF4129 domain-containing protein [Pseudactinotalea sp. HY160]|uniref:DUF4129 domain-containing protein n=1 Tax=Pseudactinotalea sp. HY160 TaxID=2654490 RepID=UPI00128D8562|nr:DUF4129 domain-containing protein [Pseudactinotalea sp. HY160]